MISVNKDICILAIESSCDETSAAVVKNGREILSNIISSQISVHVKYGGVVPEIASRKHVENISQVVDEAIAEAKIDLPNIDAIAVTCGPGLVGALLVGVSYAKALAFSLQKPIIGINHIEGHICSNFLENESLNPPFIALIVSGGHTHLVYMSDYGEYEILGHTRDDAAGEAFDKVARAIGLGYPGGPKIEAAAMEGDAMSIALPKILLEEGSLDFSFSGLKSSVLNYINKCHMLGEELPVANIAASFQKTVAEILANKTIKACKAKNIHKVVMAGGVASNFTIRKAISDACEEQGYLLNVPKPVYCTDNAAMIGSAGYFEYIKGTSHSLSLNGYPGLRLGEKVSLIN